MTIKTQYNIGDRIWRMDNNKVAGLAVMQMGINVSTKGDAPPHVTINYILSDNHRISEDDAFPDKESLLQSL